VAAHEAIRAGIANPPAFSWIPDEFPAHAITDVGEVTEIRGRPADGDIGTKRFVIATLHGIKEVLDMRRSLGFRVIAAFFDQLPVVALIDAVDRVVKLKETVGSIEYVSDAIAANWTDVANAFRDQSTNFESNLLVLELKCSVEGIRRFLIVHINEFAAGSGDAAERAMVIRQAKTPSGDIHLVDTLVAEIAVARVPKPMPVVFEPQFVKWP